MHFEAKEGEGVGSWNAKDFSPARNKSTTQRLQQRPLQFSVVSFR